jgi:hypothetical protein
VDDEDYEFITHIYEFSINRDGYVMCKLKLIYRKKKMGFPTSMSLHKILIHPEKTGRGTNVDHIDGNKLNNMKTNLRIVTHRQNMYNSKACRTMNGNEVYSKYKGVSWHIHNKNWIVHISHEGNKFEYIGRFSNEIAAANAYNYYSKMYHGEFGLINEVEYMSKDEWMKYKLGSSKSSAFRGVTFDKKWNKWIAQICHNYNRECIGSYDTEIETALAYNKRALELKGVKAKINNIN